MSKDRPVSVLKTLQVPSSNCKPNLIRYTRGNIFDEGWRTGESREKNEKSEEQVQGEKTETTKAPQKKVGTFKSKKADGMVVMGGLEAFGVGNTYTERELHASPPHGVTAAIMPHKLENSDVYLEDVSHTAEGEIEGGAGDDNEKAEELCGVIEKPKVGFEESSGAGMSKVLGLEAVEDAKGDIVYRQEAALQYTAQPVIGSGHPLSPATVSPITRTSSVTLSTSKNADMSKGVNPFARDMGVNLDVPHRKQTDMMVNSQGDKNIYTEMLAASIKPALKTSEVYEYFRALGLTIPEKIRLHRKSLFPRIPYSEGPIYDKATQERVMENARRIIQQIVEQMTLSEEVLTGKIKSGARVTRDVGFTYVLSTFVPKALSTLTSTGKRGVILRNEIIKSTRVEGILGKESVNNKNIVHAAPLQGVEEIVAHPAKHPVEESVVPYPTTTDIIESVVYYSATNLSVKRMSGDAVTCSFRDARAVDNDVGDFDREIDLMSGGATAEGEKEEQGRSGDSDKVIRVFRWSKDERRQNCGDEGEDKEKAGGEKEEEEDENGDECREEGEDNEEDGDEGEDEDEDEDKGREKEEEEKEEEGEEEEGEEESITKDIPQTATATQVAERKYETPSMSANDDSDRISDIVESKLPLTTVPVELEGKAEKIDTMAGDTSGGAVSSPAEPKHPPPEIFKKYKEEVGEGRDVAPNPAELKHPSPGTTEESTKESEEGTDEGVVSNIAKLMRSPTSTPGVAVQIGGDGAHHEDLSQKKTPTLRRSTSIFAPRGEENTQHATPEVIVEAAGCAEGVCVEKLHRGVEVMRKREEKMHETEVKEVSVVDIAPPPQEKAGVNITTTPTATAASTFGGFWTSMILLLFFCIATLFFGTVKREISDILRTDVARAAAEGGGWLVWGCF